MSPAGNGLEQQHDFNRLVVLVNPEATRANRLDSIARLNHLYKTFGKRVYQVFTTGYAEIDREIFNEAVQDGDYVGVAGGEGTMNLAIQELVRGKRKNPIFSLWWGNGNDFGNVLLGRPQNDLGRLIREADTVPIYPIEAQIINEEQDLAELKLAASYIGVGFSAIIAEHLNTEAHRGRIGYHLAPLRLAYEGMKVMQCAHSADTFTVRMGGENGEDIRMLNWLFANGPRIAKFGRMPVQYEERRIFTHAAHSPKMHEITSWLSQLAAGILAEDFIEKDDPAVAFELRTDDTPLLFDAETMRYDAGTRVAIRQHDTPFYALKISQSSNEGSGTSARVV